MRYLSAQYILTAAGPPLRRGIISVSDDGTIINVEDTNGDLREKHSVEFYNGIIIPGFINCHCHLELSYLKGEIKTGTGLGLFLMNVNTIRHDPGFDVERSVKDADDEMYREGIILCADICNTASTFSLKKKSRVRYLNLLEVFGIDADKARKRLMEIKELSGKADEYDLRWEIVPHSFYSMSIPLLRQIRELTSRNLVNSVHFLESADEITFIKDHTGPIMESYRRFLPPLAEISTVEDHVSAVIDEISNTGNLILVHNTFIEKEQVASLKRRKDMYYCLCPNSNLFIEGRIPPAEMLFKEGCDIVIGTDSLSSNHKLSILAEIKTLSNHFPGIPLEELVKWATINGAKALCDEYRSGSIEPGKRPGLLLIKDADLLNLRLKDESSVQRLI